MNLIRSLALVVIGSLTSSTVLAADLAGYWKNEKQPGWIEISFENGTGTGTVRRNEDSPELVGRVLLKEVRPDKEQAESWRGQIYAARLKEYKDATISLPTPDRMEITVKVGFMRRTIKWTRVVALPSS